MNKVIKRKHKGKAKVVSFSNQKGGVGKSTVCIQTAFYLAIKEQAKTLVLDFDAQGNTSSRLVPHETNSEGELVPVYSGTRVVDLFKKDIGPIEVIHCPCGVDLIHTLKNDHDLSEIETGLTLVDALNPRENLRELLQQYDYVLIDCPPSLGRKLYAALAMSTHVVAPVKLSGFAYDGLEGLLRTLIGVQHSTNPDLEILGVFINDRTSSLSHERAEEKIRAAIPDLVFKNTIRNRPPLDTATSDGVPIWTLPYAHVAAKEVLAVIKELLSKVNKK
ncbi:ParA family protein [Comamonas testosteroni]|uniref:Cobyric acid synthase CobQ n=1 Tax=Comamonas testosteroni TaxID=285 RepID=A0A096FM00_COMTE|nr:ParA family protein [Comamonas testosteroni]KGH30803.1 cobyric acid synthase CobQ [Comamonas testosteroni]WKL18903.1 ParA family protein [Comamonas testosteroni]